MKIQITWTRLYFYIHIVTTRQSVYNQVILHDHNMNVVILSASNLINGEYVHCTTYVTHPIYTVVCVRVVFCMITEIDITIVFCISKHRENTFYSLSV